MLTLGLIFNRMVNNLPAVFSALSDQTRFAVVDCLTRNPLSAGELAKRCAASAPAMSRHLRVLRKAGVIEVAEAGEEIQDARLRVYRLRPQPFHGLAEWAERMQAFWQDRLEGFKVHAEGRAAQTASQKRRRR